MQYECDKLHEECGIFGILDASGKNVANSIYYGLCALQHRGQESAGIAVCNTSGPLGNLVCHKDMGLVNEIFTPKTLEVHLAQECMKLHNYVSVRFASL